ncbi:MarR family transcriptional regulator [Lacrimispora indolis]|uniref:MarR family transcriptional regulator n=1 Tax=Lacrimispora indolis TaxID=69825 RepID=UPI0003FD91E4|nr:MarR family transcriptional regulator [[Clostridium] methoxybenzovorans]
MECKLIGNLFDVIAMITDEQRCPQKYNESHLLYHAEMNLIDTIYEHPNANARMLSEIMGVTQGAITQMTAKLTEKNLIEQYKLSGNKKEKYYRLTQEGDKARLGHQEYHSEANQKLCQYFCSLSDANARVILDFFEKVKECMPISEFACQSGGSCGNGMERKEE